MTKIKFAVTVSAMALLAVGALAQTGIGRKFGARDPRTCSSRKEPTRGPISAAQAKQYFACDMESFAPSGAVGDLLYLVTDIVVEVGKGRPFNALTDSRRDIDPSQTIYPIRGSYVGFQCGVSGSIGAPAGHNCARNEAANQGGNCYKDSFGDWHCSMCCVLGSNQRGGFPPPVGQ
jgi:hypothetical protein